MEKIKIENSTHSDFTTVTAYIGEKEKYVFINHWEGQSFFPRYYSELYRNNIRLDGAYIQFGEFIPEEYKYQIVMKSIVRRLIDIEKSKQTKEYRMYLKNKYIRYGKEYAEEMVFKYMENSFDRMQEYMELLSRL